MLNSEEIFNEKRILIASYRLPFNIIKEKSKSHLKQNSGGLVSAVLSLTERKNNDGSSLATNKILWFGQSDYIKNDFDVLMAKNNQFDLYPVSIPKEINKDFYEGFCNDTIWPLFHYFSIYTVFKDRYFEAYQKANLLFMNEIEKVIQPNDVIWVHDYQLMLLPKMIKEKFPLASIGFFLHIPFPSYEIFRLMKKNWGEDILKGMLGADLIGFHTNDYTQHFLKTTGRLLGYENYLRKIFTPDKVVKADAFPIGIDYEKFNNALQKPEVIKETEILKKSVDKCKLIFSVDRLDYTKGILNRLEGFDLFLERHTEWHGKVVFNMIIVPSRDSIPRYKTMKKEMEAAVGRINGKYSHLGWRPIVYQYKSIGFERLVSLYSISHCGLITPLRDGMNLVAKEYVACQGENIGVLILSELAGAVAELGEAIIINPINLGEISDAILMALEMPLEERMERNERMKNRIKNYDVVLWAEDFLNQLHLIKEEQKRLEIKLLKKEIINKMIIDYKNADNRLILLDYDGTLIPFSKFPDKALPDSKVIELLNQISKDRKNSIVIISGRNKSFLEKCFGEINVNLIAEHGIFYKTVGREWETLDANIINTEWMDTVKPLLEKYTARCYGSFIEEKETSLVWHYRSAEPDFAFVRANELKEELTEFLVHNKELHMLEGNKVIEIKKVGFDKGTSAKYFLEKSDYDFLLAIGDDRTDEDLFNVLPEKAYSVKVGLAQSVAKYNLTHQYEVNELIETLLR